MEDNDKVVSRVKKMLALANDEGAAEGERDNALRMAYNLIAKFNLSMSSIENHGTEQRIDEIGDFRGQVWATSVTSSIARLFFCHYYIVRFSATNKMNIQHHFVGKESNAVTARYMAEFVVTSIISEGRKSSRRADQGSAWRRSFFIGAADRIRARVMEMRNEEEVTNKAEVSTGTSLVIADYYKTEALKNNEWLSQQGIRLVKGKSKPTKGATSGDAYASGDAYGKTIQLNRQVSGEGQRKLN